MQLIVRKIKLIGLAYGIKMHNPIISHIVEVANWVIVNKFHSFNKTIFWTMQNIGEFCIGLPDIILHICSIVFKFRNLILDKQFREYLCLINNPRPIEFIWLNIYFLNQLQLTTFFEKLKNNNKHFILIGHCNLHRTHKYLHQRWSESHSIWHCTFIILYPI